MKQSDQKNRQPFLIDQMFHMPPRDKGPRAASRGYYYQHLFLFRLAGEIISGKIDGCISECGTDWTAWKADDQGHARHIDLYELKCRDLSSISGGQTLTEISEKLLSIATELQESNPNANIFCHLVCRRGANRHQDLHRKATDAISALHWPLRHKPRISFFLSERFEPRELREELDFLKDKHVAKLLSGKENLDRVVELFVGSTLPFYDDLRKPHVIQQLRTGSLLQLGREEYDAEEIRRKLYDAISSALEKKESRRNAFKRKLAASRLSAEKSLLGAVVSKAQPISWWPIGDDKEAAIDQIVTHQMLEGDPAFIPLFLRRNNHRLGYVWHHTDCENLLDSLGAYPSHWERLTLISSILGAFKRWTQAGICIDESFLSTSSAWLLKASGAATPTVCFSTKEGLRPFDPESSWLDPCSAIDPCLLAEIFLLIYYGNGSRIAFPQDPTAGASDDNIIAQYCDWLKQQDLINLESVERDILDFLEGCIHTWPILISSPDPQFYIDAFEAGITSPESNLTRISLMDWNVASGVAQDEIVFVRGVHQQYGHCQVGLLRDPHVPLLFRPYRIFLYQKRRWKSLWERDSILGRSLAFPGRDKVRMAYLSNPDHAESVLPHFFNTTSQKYGAWVALELSHLRNVPQDTFPNHLVALRSDYSIRLDPLETLRSLDLSIRYLEDKTGSHIIVENGDRLEKHITRCKYKPDDVPDLTLVVLGQPKRYLVRYGAPKKISGTLRFEVDESEECGLAYGSFKGYLDDAGLHAVLQTENAILTELEASFRTALPPAATRHAWDTGMQIMRGDAEASDSGENKSSSVNLSDSTLDREETSSKQVLDKLHGGEKPWHIINGAPGSGKTSLLCNVVSQFLSSLGQPQFPPPRVLIVANTHWALKNFTSKFLERFGHQHLIYLDYPKYNVDSLFQDGTLDQKQIEQIECHFREEVLPKLPSLAIKPSGNAEVMALASALTLMKNRLHEESHCEILEQPVRFGAHEEWRFDHGKGLQSTLAGLSANRSLIDQVLLDLSSANHHDALLEEDVVQFQKTDLRPYASEIVITTVDGAARLPDIGYSLVVFEEASQLTLMGLLKTLTKVIRSNLDDRVPHVILSGDPLQLPPYNPRKPFAESLPDNDENLEIKDIFPSICRNNRKSQTLLSHQYRMHPDCSFLVNHVFYLGPEWKVRSLVPTAPIYGPWWIDCNQGKTGRNEVGSWYNSEEIEVIQKITRQLPGLESRILVVTPYTEQAKRLRDSLPQSIRIRTIDGCQGIDADIVIISFVHFGNVFSRDQRRINVAISRSRAALLCVGNHRTLLEEGNQKPLAKLASIFSDGGIFSKRRLPSSSWADIFIDGGNSGRLE